MKKGDLESEESKEENGRSLIVTREQLHKAEDSDPKQSSAKSLTKSSSKSLKTSSTKGRKSISSADVRKNGSAFTRRKLAEGEENGLVLKKSKFFISDNDITSSGVINRDSDTGTPKASKLLRGKKKKNSSMPVMESDSRRQRGVTSAGNRQKKSVVTTMIGRNSPEVTPKCVRQRAARGRCDTVVGSLLSHITWNVSTHKD